MSMACFSSWTHSLNTTLSTWRIVVMLRDDIAISFIVAWFLTLRSWKEAHFLWQAQHIPHKHLHQAICIHCHQWGWIATGVGSLIWCPVCCIAPLNDCAKVCEVLVPINNWSIRWCAHCLCLRCVKRLCLLMYLIHQVFACMFCFFFANLCHDPSSVANLWCI